jgi:hypothetical protein
MRRETNDLTSSSPTWEGFQARTTFEKSQRATENGNTHCQGRLMREADTILFATIALAFLYSRTFLLPRTPLVASGDEVLFFAHANRILQGQVPFRDYFAFMIPGADLLYAGAFKVLGVHAWLAQGFVILLGFTTACLVLWISRSILSGPTVFLPGLLFLVLDYNSALDVTHHWYSTLFVMAAAATLMGGTGVGKILIAGALCGTATIFTQTRGPLGLLALGLYLAVVVKRTKRETSLSIQLISLVLPFFVIVTGILTYYVHQAGFKSVLYGLGYFAFTFLPTAPEHSPGAYFMQVPPHHTPRDLVRMAPFVFIYALVPFVYIFCMLRLCRRLKSMVQQLWERVLLVSLIGIALFASVMTEPTYHRLCMVAPPAIILFVWFFSGMKLMDRAMRIFLWATAAGLVLYLPVCLQLHWRAYLNLPTGRTAFIDPVLYEETKWFAQKTHAGEGFFTEPRLSFALRLDNPTPLDYVTPYEFTRPEQVDAVVRALEDHQTTLIYLYPGLNVPRKAGDNLAPFRQYVYKKYHVVKIYRSGQFWERN